MRRQLNHRIRTILAASLFALTSLALAATTVLADGGGSNIPH